MARGDTRGVQEVPAVEEEGRVKLHYAHWRAAVLELYGETFMQLSSQLCCTTVEESRDVQCCNARGFDREKHK